ncbi:MAG TPA: helix-turn-helix domain-containing protein [Polyangiaceae bacterium]
MRRSAKRRYESPKREAARDATRAAIVAAAGRVLRGRGWEDFSLDEVARAAGVTRLTVYHQFGDRRGLLEAVFDQEAMRAGLGDIAGAMAGGDAREALGRVVEIFCSFWRASKPMQGIMAAAAADSQLAEAIAARNERRRKLLGVLVERLRARGDVDPARAHALVDTLFALTSYAFYAELEKGTTLRRRDAAEHAVAALVALAVDAAR